MTHNFRCKTNETRIKWQIFAKITTTTRTAEPLNINVCFNIKWKFFIFIYYRWLGVIFALIKFSYFTKVFFSLHFFFRWHKMVIKSKGNQAETTNEKKRKIIMVSRINQIVGWKKIEVWKMWKLRKTKIHLKNEIYLKTLNKSHFTDHHHWTHTHFQHNERCCRVFK